MMEPKSLSRSEKMAITQFLTISDFFVFRRTIQQSDS